MLDFLYPKYYLQYEEDTSGGGSDVAATADTGGAVYPEDTPGFISSLTSPVLQSIVAQPMVIPAIAQGAVLTPKGIVSTPLTVSMTPVSGVMNKIGRMKFKAKSGYYYSKPPIPNLNFPGGSDYKVTFYPEDEIRDVDGRVTGVTYTISYIGDGSSFDFDRHDIYFTHETKPLPTTGVYLSKEITSIEVDTTDLPSNGKSLPITINGTVGTFFSLSIKDKNNKNIVPSATNVIKVTSTAVTHSQRIDFNEVTYLKVGMQIFGDGIGGGVVISSVKDVESPYIIISKPQTVSANIALTFSEDSVLDNIKIPTKGVYKHKQVFPRLKKYIKTLKTAASSTTTLILDDVTNLEVGMRITGTGVDGNNPTISTIDSNTQITVSETQTITDETELTFTQINNQYNITVTPKVGDKLGGGIPIGFPTLSIGQYIDPIITIEPSTTLANATVTGSVSYTKPINTIPEVTPSGRPTKGTKRNLALATISMVITSTSGAIVIDRQPRFSNSILSLSDFTNIASIKKSIITYSGTDTTLVVLNNTTDLIAGMRVTGRNIIKPSVYNSPCGDEGLEYKEVTIKTVENDKVITLSSPQTLLCSGGTLTFDNGGTAISIKDLSATLSNYNPGGDAGVVDGVCTVTGTAIISQVGKYSLTSTINFDDFLSKA